MPIIKGDNGETVVQFGDGDVLICASRQQGQTVENEISLVRDEPHPIGEYTEKHMGKTTADIDCPVRLQFAKSESVGVLIERLQHVKAQLEAAGY